MNKLCSKCKTEYPATKEFFSSAKRSKDGLRSACKNCVSTLSKKYYQENKEKFSSYNKKYYQENKEKLVLRNKKYYQENKEKFSSHNKKYYQENKEKFSSDNKKYYQENKEKLVAYYKEKRKMLGPRYVAQCMGISIEDLTPEIYETKKLIIQLRREVK